VRIYERLKINCNINNFDIEPHNMAISDSNGMSVLYDLPEAHHYRASLDRAEVAHLSNNLIEQTIMTRKIDTFMAENSMKKLDLMKIDVEGYEPNVLRGATEIIYKQKPSMIMEIKNENHAHQIAEIGKEFNYLYFDIDEQHGVRRLNTLEKSSSLNVLLCNSATAQSLGL